jgi:hypothetical protein
MPADLFGVMQRHKDITFQPYSLQYRQGSRNPNAMRALENLIQKLPPELRNDPDVEHPERKSLFFVDIVIIGRNATSAFRATTNSLALGARTLAGQRDMRQTYEHPDWLAVQRDAGVTAYDLATPSNSEQRARLGRPASPLPRSTHTSQFQGDSVNLYLTERDRYCRTPQNRRGSSRCCCGYKASTLMMHSALQQADLSTDQYHRKNAQP